MRRLTFVSAQGHGGSAHIFMGDDDGSSSAVLLACIGAVILILVVCAVVVSVVVYCALRRRNESSAAAAASASSFAMTRQPTLAAISASGDPRETSHNTYTSIDEATAQNSSNTSAEADWRKV